MSSHALQNDKIERAIKMIDDTLKVIQSELDIDNWNLYLALHLDSCLAAYDLTETKRLTWDEINSAQKEAINLYWRLTKM